MPAFAGLAGAAAILLVLVVALPRLGPGGPSPSPGLLAAPPSTISLMPVREFAARVAAGELRGETVLVNAQIASNPALFLRPCPPPGPCYLGDLLGTDPLTPVQTRWYPTLEGEGTELTGPGIDPVWAWWDRPQTPMEGVMVLSVDANGSVMFVGRNPPEEIASALSEIQYIDFDAMPLEEIRVVPAWLTGIVGPLRCGPAGQVPYLPDGRGCVNPSWLTRERSRFARDGFVTPEGAIKVQGSAYSDYAPEPVSIDGSAEPRAGAYVVARRLAGTCPGSVEPPCWIWQVVGRLTINGDATLAEPFVTPEPSGSPVTPLPTATPTPPPVVAIECTASPEEFLATYGHVTFGDQAGVVESCAAVAATGESPVFNPGGDMRTLQIEWQGRPCEAEGIFTLARAGTDFTLLETFYERSCRTSLVRHAILLTLSEDVDAGSVITSQAQIPLPPLTPPSDGRLECPYGAAYARPTEVTVLDHTGLVGACQASVGSGETTPEPTVNRSYHSSYGEGISVTWEVSSVCTHMPAHIEVFAMPTEDAGTRYTIHVDLLDAPVGEQQGCLDVVGTQSVHLYPTDKIAPGAVDVILTRASAGVDSEDTEVGTFTLRLIEGAIEYAANEPIDIRAELTYDGPTETTELWGAGLMDGFRVRQLDGPFSLSDIHPMWCVPLSLTSGAPLVVDFRKGQLVDGDGPIADRSVLEDPELGLPPGTWRITVSSTFSTGSGCSRDNVLLDSSVVIVVR
ncbi:MAG: hypothetical protein WD830_02065 [Chloroflexota bacterium]